MSLRRLLLMRHAKSAWDSGAPDDFDRPLAKRGKKDVPLIGAWLRRQGRLPDYLVSSPAQRARETALGLGEVLGIGKKRVHWDARIYEAAVEDLLAVLADTPVDATLTLLIGHNPGLDGLLVHLVGDQAVPNSKGKLLTTAAVAGLTMPADWRDLEAGCARLERLQRPKELGA